MAKRWTFHEDVFLHEFFDAVGDWVGTHDFGRPKGAATRRVAMLKFTGAWDALTRRRQAEVAYRQCLGLSCEYEDDALHTEPRETSRG